MTASQEEGRRPAAAHLRLVAREGFIASPVVPSCSHNGLIRPDGSKWFLRKRGQIFATVVAAISSRQVAETNRAREKVSCVRARLAAVGVRRTQWQVISSDRSGRNRTKVCPPQPPSPSSFAIPIRTRASAHGVPAAKFAAAMAAASLAAALRYQLARWEVQEPEAIQLFRATWLDVAGAAAPRTWRLVFPGHLVPMLAATREKRRQMRATPRHGSTPGECPCVS